jgi:hypothetical protein
MPLLKHQTSNADDALWFQPECEHDPIAFTDDNMWNRRHRDLRDIFAHNWILKPPPHGGEWESVSKIVGDSVIFGYHGATGAVLIHWPTKAMAARRKSDELRVEFEALSKQWRRDTRHLSLISKKIVHPAYLRIIGMGEAAIPLILESLRDRPSHWFDALRATANTNPTKPDDTPSQAREAWLLWGVENGYID